MGAHTPHRRDVWRLHRDELHAIPVGEERVRRLVELVTIIYEYWVLAPIKGGILILKVLEITFPVHSLHIVPRFPANRCEIVPKS